MTMPHGMIPPDVFGMDGLFVSALITDCRYAGLQDFCAMPRHLDYSHRKVFLGTRSCLRRLISAPDINSLSDRGGKPMKNRRPVLNALHCFAALSILLLSGPARTFAQDNTDY
jgi:hypothetical protein